jgi:hypothetical protein
MHKDSLKPLDKNMGILNGLTHGYVEDFGESLMRKESVQIE